MIVKSISLLLLLVLLFLVPACAQKESPKPASPVVKEEKAAPASQEVKSSWQQEWDSLLLAAKREGKLVIYSSMTPEVRQALVDNFGKKFGINTEIVIGRGAENAQK